MANKIIISAAIILVLSGLYSLFINFPTQTIIGIGISLIILLGYWLVGVENAN